MGDVDDVDIYVAPPIFQWQQTEQGRWVMEHATNLEYHSQIDQTTWGTRIIITGDLEDIKATEYFLRWEKEKF